MLPNLAETVLVKGYHAQTRRTVRFTLLGRYWENVPSKDYQRQFVALSVNSVSLELTSKQEFQYPYSTSRSSCEQLKYQFERDHFTYLV